MNLFEAIMDDVFGANIDARTAKDTFCVFHITALDHIIDFKAHLTFFVTTFALNTFFLISSKTQRRYFKSIFDFRTDDHKRRDPTDIMTKTSFT